MKKTKREIELQKELNKIQEEKFEFLINEAYPKIKAKYEGKYFVYDNGYNAEARWPLYISIGVVNKEDLYVSGEQVLCNLKGISFQTDTYGEVSIKTKYKTYGHLMEKEISEHVFNTAWNKMIDALNQL